MHLIQRGFEMQSRTVLCTVHPAEARTERELALIDDEHRAPQQQRVTVAFVVQA